MAGLLRHNLTDVLYPSSDGLGKQVHHQLKLPPSVDTEIERVVLDSFPVGFRKMDFVRYAIHQQLQREAESLKNDLTPST